MPTELQQAALRSYADHPERQLSEHVRAVHDATGSPTLTPVIDAVKWALNHPSAETLPERSIVASADVVWMKREPLLGFPWTTDAASTDGQRLWTNNAITKLIQSGEATVLRVGTGT